jgi:hypothetical protein
MESHEIIINNLIPEYKFILSAISAPFTFPGLCTRWALLKSICQNNVLVGQGLLDTWTGMTVQQRTELLLELSNGSMDEPGVALLCPEINLQQLSTDPTKLSALIERVLSYPMEYSKKKDGVIDGTCYFELGVDFVENLYAQKKLKRRAPLFKKAYCWTRDEFFDIQKSNDPSIREQFEIRTFVDDEVAENSGLRLQTLFDTLLIACVDILLFAKGERRNLKGNQKGISSLSISAKDASGSSGASKSEGSGLVCCECKKNLPLKEFSSTQAKKKKAKCKTCILVQTNNK